MRAEQASTPGIAGEGVQSFRRAAGVRMWIYNSKKDTLQTRKTKNAARKFLRLGSKVSERDR